MKLDDLTKPILPLPIPRLPSPLRPIRRQHLVPPTLQQIPLVLAQIPLLPQKRKRADLSRRLKKTGGEQKAFVSIVERRVISTPAAPSCPRIGLLPPEKPPLSLLRQKRSRKTRQRLRKSRRSPESALSSRCTSSLHLCTTSLCPTLVLLCQFVS